MQGSNLALALLKNLWHKQPAQQAPAAVAIKCVIELVCECLWVEMRREPH